MDRTKSHCTEALISLQASPPSYNNHFSQSDLKQLSLHTLTDLIPPRPSNVAMAVSGFPLLYGLRDELASTAVILGLDNWSGCDKLWEVLLQLHWLALKCLAESCAVVCHRWNNWCAFFYWTQTYGTNLDPVHHSIPAQVCFDTRKLRLVFLDSMITGPPLGRQKFYTLLEWRQMPSHNLKPLFNINKPCGSLLMSPVTSSALQQAGLHPL